MNTGFAQVLHIETVDDVGPGRSTRPRDARDARPRAEENLLPTTATTPSGGWS